MSVELVGEENSNSCLSVYFSQTQKYHGTKWRVNMVSVIMLRTFRNNYAGWNPSCVLSCSVTFLNDIMFY